MTMIRIKNGSYRGNEVKDQCFLLVKGFRTGKKGNYVTVQNEEHFPEHGPVIKIKIDSTDDIEFIGNPGANKTESVVETDDEAMERIQTRFDILEQMAAACTTGDIRALIVTGPPGVGKSHGILEQMTKASLFDKIASRKPRYEVVKGVVSGIGLFCTLYQYSDPNNVIIFDDCDVWSDPDALNILKGALDSGKTRRISWNKDSRKLREDGIPNSFDFKGSVIFITNVDVANVKRNMIRAHLDALQSRAHYLDLTINTMRDKMLRIRQVHRDHNLFADHNFSAKQGEEIIDFMEENKDNLREVSLRMAIKMADLVKVSPDNWRNLSKATCMI